MSVVALTGGIGAGKSLAAQYFSELGARVVDADQLARLAIERGSEGFDEVLLRFGEAIMRDGDIDRKALAEIIFSDPKAKADLEGIIHPIVRQLFAEVVSDLASDEILIYEIPLLVETGAVANFDVIITIEADLEIRKDRLRKRGMFISEIDPNVIATEGF
jgi:dephospho-CoA kinase